MAWSQNKINEVYMQIQRRAATDEEFRANLLKDPNGTVAKLAGEALPDDYKINVIENDPNYAATFVLPVFDASGELSDAELDNVAGGACGSDVGVCGADNNCGGRVCGGFVEK